MLLALPSSASLVTTTPAAIRPVLRPRAQLLATRTALGPADLVSEPTSTASGSAAFSWEANWEANCRRAMPTPCVPTGSRSSASTSSYGRAQTDGHASRMRAHTG